MAKDYFLFLLWQYKGWYQTTLSGTFPTYCNTHRPYRPQHEGPLRENQSRCESHSSHQHNMTHDIVMETFCDLVQIWAQWNVQALLQLLEKCKMSKKKSLYYQYGLNSGFSKQWNYRLTFFKLQTKGVQLYIRRFQSPKLLYKKILKPQAYEEEEFFQVFHN